MKKLLFACLLAGALLACGNETNNGKKIEEVESAGKISSIIRNPETADGVADTINVAKLTFAETRFNFGEIDEGGVVKHTFKFTNTGKVPLIISDARSTCGCTVPEWPAEPVAPGEEGEIFVKFDTKNKKDKQSKPITITANTYPSQTKIHLDGYVHSLK